MRNKSNNTLKLYIFGIVILLVSIAFILLYYYGFLRIMQGLKAPCMFRTVTGYYCPGCGITRSIKSLLSGDFIRCFMYHPFVFYVIIMYIIFMVKNTVYYVARWIARLHNNRGDGNRSDSNLQKYDTKGNAELQDGANKSGNLSAKLKHILVGEFSPRLIYLYIGVIILFLQWILKNVFLVLNIGYFV